VAGWIEDGIVQEYSHEGENSAGRLESGAFFDSSDGTVTGAPLNAEPVAVFSGWSEIGFDPHNGDFTSPMDMRKDGRQ